MLPRPLVALTALLAIIGVGTVGYSLIESWSALDALYMAVITITTVGFMEVHPLSPIGRAFTIVIVVAGVGTAAYGLGGLIEYAVAGELTGSLRERRRKRALATLSGHYIVCGYGRVGREIVRELTAAHTAFVVVEEDAQAVEECRDAGHLCVLGDATLDATLEEAGISRAAALLTSLDSDSENLYVVLSARGLRPDLLIVARADLEESEPKMLRAGATRVISPHTLGGRRMASLALRPEVVQFLDLVMHTENLELWLEQVEVAAESPLAGCTLAEAGIRSRTGVSVLAMYAPGGEVVTNPEPSQPLEPGSRLIVLGTRVQLQELCSLVSTGTCRLL